MYNLNDYIIFHDIIDEMGISDKNILEMEIFYRINDDHITGIKPNNYYISNYSRIYSKCSKKFMRSKINKTTGYYDISLQMEAGNSVTISIHRLLMMVIKPLESYDMVVVNHIDGNKLNNNLYNLEWVSYKENMIHASEHGLLHPVYGENHNLATLTNDTCEDICKLLESRRYQNKEIAKIFNIPVYIVDDIRSQKSWVHISKNYDISYDKERISSVFTYDELHSICNYFQNNPKSEILSLRKYLIITLRDIGFHDICESTINSIRKLYKKERWKYIYKYYNY